MTTDGKLGLDPLLERGKPQLAETSDRRLRERLIGEVGERRPAPQRERLAQLLHSRRGIGAAGLGDEPLEAGDVELGRVDPQHVAGRAGEEPAVAELFAQPGNVALDDLCDRRRRRLPPQLVDQPLRRDDVVGVQQQDGEQRPLLAAAEHERTIVLDHLQRAKKPKFQSAFDARRYHP